ncbi:EAL domain-containing protein [Pelagibacterium xiamenense]|uniref:EAL domain-containing protein n=1 Tax=Pelagibacterium xiamenense TaxID=2901140 RepID=UPI001E4AF6C2|nr:EAL domain-containing protein [Pelagibacterium xiamenense]MCD7060269.1 EAL domain-containing protein [Pelagibacterium xiamenense]
MVHAAGKALKSNTARRVLAGLAILCAAALATFWNPIDRPLMDARFALRDQPASGEIVFVALDAASLEAVGVWPWPRDLYADLIDATLDAGATDVFVDIDFSARSTEAADARLEEALEASGGYAYLAAFGQQSRDGQIHNARPLERFLRHVDPFSVNVIVDDAGQARQLPSAMAIGGTLVRSLPMWLHPGEALPPAIGIDFGISAASIPTISAASVLDGTVSPGAFMGKSVIIGASAVELQDFFFTPGQGAIPGALIQVLAAESVAQDRALASTGPAPALALLGVFLALMLAAHRRVGLWNALAATVGLALGAEAAAHGAYQFEATMIPTGPLLVGLALYGIWRILSETRIRQFIIERVTGERNQMQDVLRRVVDDNFDGVIVVDENRRILAASGLAKSWLGDDLVGAPVADVMPGPFLDDLHKIFEETSPALGNASIARERDIRMPNGTFTIEYVITESRVATGTSGRAFATLTFRDVTARRKHEAELRYLAEHDALTGALVHTSFVALLEQKIHTLGPASEIGVLVIDLRRFKSVNATLGHQLGDEMLRQVVSRLTAAGHKTVARLGGDRFAIEISGPEASADAPAVFAEIVGLLAIPFNLSGHHAVIGVSGGWAFAAGAREGGEALLRHADMALAIAATRPGDQMAMFEPSMDDNVAVRRGIEEELRAALRQNQLSLHYQPQYALAGGSPVGAEALIRWEHPRHGRMRPDRFIPVAEETGLIAEIGRFALEQACRQAMSWPECLSVAVNVSPVQFELSDVVADVRAALRISGLAPERLEIEVTESILLSHKDSAIATLQAISALGVKIAIDDFGTGFSSLAYLASLPFDLLKIDKSFVDSMHESPSARAVIESIVALGKKLGKTVLAEGIETADQAAGLTALGCDLGQGYLYSRPVPAAEINDLVAHLADRDTPAPRPQALSSTAQ